MLNWMTCLHVLETVEVLRRALGAGLVLGNSKPRAPRKMKVNLSQLKIGPIFRIWHESAIGLALSGG